MVFLTDPTGAYLSFDAIAIGAGSDQVNEYLEKNYDLGLGSRRDKPRRSSASTS